MPVDEQVRLAVRQLEHGQSLSQRIYSIMRGSPGVTTLIRFAHWLYAGMIFGCNWLLSGIEVPEEPQRRVGLTWSDAVLTLRIRHWSH